jgi:hypothetical protein
MKAYWGIRGIVEEHAWNILNENQLEESRRRRGLCVCVCGGEGATVETDLKEVGTGLKCHRLKSINTVL